MSKEHHRTPRKSRVVSAQLERAINLREAVAINVITMIGIGPLITIPLVLAQLAGPLALVGWIAGAIVALCDGLVWAELATRYPGTGGTYAYLREIFGPQRWGRFFAFLYNWQFFLSSSLVIATGYIGFADYAGYIFPQLARIPALNHAVAAGVGVVTVALLYRRIGIVARLGVMLAIVAIGTLMLVGIAGFAHADFHRALALAAPPKFGWQFLAGFGSALYITLYDYAGYSEIALVGEEVREPRRTLPFSIIASILIVLVLYLFVQVGVLGAVRWQSLVAGSGALGTNAQFVASAVVAHAWGRGAAYAVTVLILITAFASVYGGLLGNSRVPFAAARDGVFLPFFSKVHPREHFPHLSLLAMGAISIIACFFDLGTVIAILSSAGILVGSIGQIVALFVMRAHGQRAPFRMWLFPLPALIALAGWILAYSYTGALAIVIGLIWLVAGAILFLTLARAQRCWPFAVATIAGLLLLVLPRASFAEPYGTWRSWNTSRVVQVSGYPVFEVDGKPFFVWGAAFFYERVPRDEWGTWLRLHRSRLHINTIDLYVPWNWQEPAEGHLDFTGRTNPRRDLLGLFKIIDRLGFKVVLRPGPVIRNEWRNGGYPAWLLERPEYNMPLHDVLEGRYPATATLQNQHADAAANEWLHNATHVRYASLWLRDVLTALEPYSHDVIAIALDDDQGAYPDNDTWPAPHWHTYINWLKSIVHSVTGDRVPVFINTWQMKETASSPVWAWGNWYQSSAYRIGEHDREQLDLSTDLLGTQSHEPVMISEFQAGWLQGADEGAPRPADPANTTLALGELLADGAHGIVNFPVQDTIYPAGWEVPWANRAYDWDAALGGDVCGRAMPRFEPTASFGAFVTLWNTLLAKTHPSIDAAIIWPPSLFRPGTLNDAQIARDADATLTLLNACHKSGLTCSLTDLRFDADNGRIPVLLPIAVAKSDLALLAPGSRLRLAHLTSRHLLLTTLAGVHRRAVMGSKGEASLLLSDDSSSGFLLISNWNRRPRTVGPYQIHLADDTVRLPSLHIAGGAARVIPLRLATAKPKNLPLHAPACNAFPHSNAFKFGHETLYAADTASHAQVTTADVFHDGSHAVIIQDAEALFVLDPSAGARFAAASVPGPADVNFASTIGLLRDAVDPEPTPSNRDYIAAATHPLPAGTFNRPYRCSIERARLPEVRVFCSYDAPDIPDGGARFERTLSLANGSDELLVRERMISREAMSAAHLKSISGFAVGAHDVVLSPKAGQNCFAVYDTATSELARLCWRPSDLGSREVRLTRGAAILTLHFSRNDVAMRLGVLRAASRRRAQALLSLP